MGGLFGVGRSSGYAPVPSEPSGPQTSKRAAGDGSSRAELRPSDIPPRQASHGVRGADGKSVNVSQLRPVPKSEQTPQQRSATKATAEKPSLLRRFLTGLTGAISGAIGGIGAGLYATGGAVTAAVKLFEGSPPFALGAALFTTVVAGGACVAAGILGGTVAGAVHGAKSGKFRDAAGAAAVPVQFTVDRLSVSEEKKAPPTPSSSTRG